MAIETSKALRNMVMYSIYVRNYSDEGSFKAVGRDLERIKKLGVDIIWLMPIHPVGKVKRKGTLGSPYAISDYRAINPELGTMENFKALVEAIHTHDMKCIIDIVFNHTSPDSWLAQNHPEWFYKKPDGSFGNKTGEWWDVVDLDFSQTGLWDYLIDTLKIWAGMADGFRCDVAPLIPLEFWIRARKEVAQVNPDCLWLSESVEPSFTLSNRARGLVSLSDSEIFQAFDMSYEYDIFSCFHECLKNGEMLEKYAEKVNAQEYIYPDNYVKLRFLENHDQPRIKSLISDRRSLINWTAFCYFQKGMTLIYAGQETENDVRPSLFEKDTVQWDTGSDISGLLRRLYEMKKNPVMTDSSYNVSVPAPNVLLAVHEGRDKKGTLLGIFCVNGEPAVVHPQFPDGMYENIADGKNVQITDGKISTDGLPVIIFADSTFLSCK